jgi:hypothetical protein
MSGSEVQGPVVAETPLAATFRHASKAAINGGDGPVASEIYSSDPPIETHRQTMAISCHSLLPPRSSVSRRAVTTKCSCWIASLCKAEFLDGNSYH